jgi:hypothetical protein
MLFPRNYGEVFKWISGVIWGCGLIKRGGFMQKPDEELKLNIDEIFGADWAAGPESQTADLSVASVEPQLSEENKTNSDIKFNDLSNKPTVEPMVLVVKSNNNSSGFPVDSVKTEPVEVKPIVLTEKTEGEPTEAESPSIIVKAGTTGTGFEPQDFFIAYDRFREIFLEELKDSVGPKKTCVMLVKTFEAAREKHPEVFRNANWDASGNLLEDGSLNAQRMLDNKNLLDQKQAEIILDTALALLLNFRLQAVEKGLGSECSTRIRTHLKKWSYDESQKDG